jgi:DEAD/DEAH box helicase domain-containing protein
MRGLASLLRHTIPLYVLCDSRDFTVHSTLRSPFDQRPAIFVWDRYPGGIGIARRVHAMVGELLVAGRRLVGDCACGSGCPACIGAQLEADQNVKAATLALLSRLAP